MRKRRQDREAKPAEQLEEQRAAREAASRDERLREQVKTETEERPYLDTQGGE